MDLDINDTTSVSFETGLPIGVGAIKVAVDAKRGLASELFGALAKASPGHPGIMRDTYGAGENAAHRLVAGHARNAGLAVRTDAAANTYVTWPGSDPALPAILLGSHLDSVPHGGNFDGAAGVLAGLIVIAALSELGMRPARNVTVMGIRAEESVWFEVSYIGSRSALGRLPAGALDATRIDDRRSLAEHIDECGGNSDALRQGEADLRADAILAFLEVHIEQAPSLLESGVPLGICTGVPGNFRYPNARIHGRHDHVGTPRRFRHDAAMAGADLAMSLDALWGEMEADGVPLAITFGRFHTDPAVHGMTTVPGAFEFSLDVRAYDPAVLARCEQRMLAIVADIERRRGVRFDLGRRASAAVGAMNGKIAGDLADAASRLAVPFMPLGSPASHDAAAFAEAGVPVGMLFVRNENGSHNPDEDMTIDDFLQACAVLALWVANHAGRPSA